MRRRSFFARVAALAGVAAVRVRAQGRFQPPQDITPLINEITKGVAPEKKGVEVELPLLVENGNTVPLRVRVASPMTEADHVKAIHVFAERNPRPRVASFYLGPACGKAEVSARIRLAGTQQVTVLAELSGGRFRVGPRDVLVTSGACLDDASL
ncbi:MAG TPA: thiosulfate oxidation carrier protein SoxY [Usitatibacter sp.]|nr:thiosulfate oxidation carrier protein SoxY [Usitatibacter sp.]